MRIVIYSIYMLPEFPTSILCQAGILRYKRRMISLLYGMMFSSPSFLFHIQ